MVHCGGQLSAVCVLTFSSHCPHMAERERRRKRMSLLRRALISPRGLHSLDLITSPRSFLLVPSWGWYLVLGLSYMNFGETQACRPKYWAKEYSHFTV